jgi:hypothetical protein
MNSKIINECLKQFYNLFSKIPKHIQISQRYGVEHHAIWLIGNTMYHLDRKNDNKVLPENWSTRFSNDSRPLPIATLYPSGEDIKRYWDVLVNKDYDDIYVVFMIGLNLGRLKSYIEIHHNSIFYEDDKKNSKEVKEIVKEELKKCNEAKDSGTTEEKKEVQGEDFECTVCGRKFSKKFALTNHINNSHRKVSD